MTKVILTHEQADFDAIASQLGAWILDPDGQPVLPTRINRNVRAFLTIYGAELPFIERGDLPAGPIGEVTLVDTQSMISLKGMQDDMQVYVVDHHDRQKVFPAGWEGTVQPVGANATLLVEAIRDRGAALTPIQATLLLLGIYEDTGSLTYTRTTPRDLRAAAHLIDAGANLQTVGDYLNQPLSIEQQALFERLLESHEIIQVHGHSIILAAGDARGTNEELSSIAHKMRDLLDPDGLFLLIEIGGGVQFIARSTSDHVNVARAMRHFGGGGHVRAAAAMVKKGDMQALLADLRARLPEIIQPAIRVEQIMSRTPQLLTPDTSPKTAQERMQRYGYEGYPVVEAGRVIGLLTRRAVDRAVAHGMKDPIRRIMQSGDHSLRPDQSIEEVQTLMVETGWGQVPVVDPENGAVIGIVTRTDLLKTLSDEPAVPGRKNLGDRLEQALSQERFDLLKKIAAEARSQGSALFIVGGFVRDLLLDKAGVDFDLVVEGSAITLANALAKAHGGRVTAHKRFGTAKWHQAGDEGGPEAVDLITARTEFYTHPTALPTVERGSIKLDLHRRDFTINTLALRLDDPHFGELHDYWGGEHDIRQKRIRVLHSLSFVDDPTRMLRAVRFEQRFGFQIEPRTLELLRAALGLLDRVSGDRIRHELDYILNEAQAAAMIERLEQLDLLAAIHPALAPNPALLSYLKEAREPAGFWELGEEFRGVPLQRAIAYILLLRSLPADLARKVTRRLKMLQALESVILDACEIREFQADLPDLPPSRITALLDEASRIAVYASALAADNPAEAEKINRYGREWRHIQPQTDGNDLQARGLAPGPAYKTILTRLRAAWLDGEVASPEGEQQLLDSLIQAEQQA